MPIVRDQISGDAINASKVEDGSLTGTDLADGTVTEAKIVDLGKEGAATLSANIKRRGEELGYDTLPAEGIVLGTGTQYKVEPAASPDMSVRVQASNASGACYAADGTRYEGPGTALTAAIGVADVTNPRYDLISLKPDGTLRVTAGTPAGSPAVPALPANDVKLAVIKIAANDTAINSGDIFDHRFRAGKTPDEEENTADGNTSSWDLARRICPAQFKHVRMYRNGLRAKQAVGASADLYQVSNAVEKNGSTITTGANPGNGDRILTEYVY